MSDAVATAETNAVAAKGIIGLAGYSCGTEAAATTGIATSMTTTEARVAGVPRAVAAAAAGDVEQSRRSESPLLLKTGGRSQSSHRTPLPCLGSSPIRRVASL